MAKELYIGLMSGTSLDGVDGVLVDFSGPAPSVLADAHIPFPATLRDTFHALQAPGDNEIHREALAGNALARLYAACVGALLQQAQCNASAVRAIGAHGQTVRHQPGAVDGIGYTRQTLNAALLAEATGIDVIADLRSRDVAAGGQGAPLVPAVHRALFGDADEARVACNIGGISNISILPPLRSNAPVLGFDCGPGNVLLDCWVQRQQGKPYDEGGAWALGGKVDTPWLTRLLQEPYFRLPPPKSTGRDLFNPDWLDRRLPADVAPVDVQATLAALTAAAIADDILRHAPDTRRLIVSGGGAHNAAILQGLRDRLPGVQVQTSAALGVPAHQVEALAFAWLARQCVLRAPGNLPSVTGAAGPRVLGALYPA